jgi:uncharacterized protein (TIGR02599 family)
MLLSLLVRGNGRRAFTLIELLTATAVFTLLLGFLLAALNQTTRVWRQSTNTLEAYKSSREAFNLMVQRLSEATLNTYWAYQFETINGQQVPKSYRRESDLQFYSGPGLAGTSHAVFFQAPGGFTESSSSLDGMNKLLNDFGFYILHGTDEAWRPPPADGISSLSRYRLIQLTVPTEQSGPFSSNRGTAWQEPHVRPGAAEFASVNTPIGENIIAIALLPKRAPLDEVVHGALPGGFSYNSKTGASSNPQPVTANQLPPLVEVVMIVIDESSAVRLAQTYGRAQPPEIQSALNGRLGDPSNLENDLEQISKALDAAKIQHKVFRSTIPIHSSKWSES